MTRNRIIAVLLLGASLSACGGNDTRGADCDDDLRFQNRVESKRVVVPEGLDPLDELGEMPIPKADPNAAQIPPGRCPDMPPSVRSGT